MYDITLDGIGESYFLCAGCRITRERTAAIQATACRRYPSLNALDAFTWLVPACWTTCAEFLEASIGDGGVVKGLRLGGGCSDKKRCSDNNGRDCDGCCVSHCLWVPTGCDRHRVCLRRGVGDGRRTLLRSPTPSQWTKPEARHDHIFHAITIWDCHIAIDAYSGDPTPMYPKLVIRLTRGVGPSGC